MPPSGRSAGRVSFRKHPARFEVPVQYAGAGAGTDSLLAVGLPVVM